MNKPAKKIEMEQQQEAVISNDDEMDSVNGGGPGVNTFWGVQDDGQLATSPQKKPLIRYPSGNGKN